MSIFREIFLLLAWCPLSVLAVLGRETAVSLTLVFTQNCTIKRRYSPTTCTTFITFSFSLDFYRVIWYICSSKIAIKSCKEKQMNKEMIHDLFKTNHWVATHQTDGLTHEDSLLQLPFRGNCLNWVLGHILVSRESALKMLGIDGSWTEAEIARYKFDSEPITSPDDPAILSLERLLADFERTQEQIADGFAEISEHQLAEKDERGRTVAERLLFLAWHEGYHLGQTEYLRQLAGKDDKVI
jgi:hypothetical protein